MAMLYAKENPKRIKGLLFLTIPLLVVVILVLPLSIAAVKEYHRYTRNITVVQKAPVAIIFGASVNPDRQLSLFLQDRVEGGVRLYADGKVQHLLMTGDHRSTNYNEPAAMTAYAIARGVPATAIMQDGEGIDTFSSCERAYSVFAVRQAVLVTQGYHQPRALALCRAEGIQASGYAVTDWHRYAVVTAKYVVREALSMWKAGYNILIPRLTFELQPHERSHTVFSSPASCGVGGSSSGLSEPDACQLG